jgi:hypothetical protein
VISTDAGLEPATSSFVDLHRNVSEAENPNRKLVISLRSIQLSQPAGTVQNARINLVRQKSGGKSRKRQKSEKHRKIGKYIPTPEKCIPQKRFVFQKTEF